MSKQPGLYCILLYCPVRSVVLKILFFLSVLRNGPWPHIDWFINKASCSFPLSYSEDKFVVLKWSAASAINLNLEFQNNVYTNYCSNQTCVCIISVDVSSVL